MEVYLTALRTCTQPSKPVGINAVTPSLQKEELNMPMVHSTGLTLIRLQ